MRFSFSFVFAAQTSVSSSVGSGVLTASLHQPFLRLKEQRHSGPLRVSVQTATFDQPPPDPIIDLRTIFLPDFDLATLDEEETARQLTMLFSETFLSIRPAELLSWTRPDRVVRSPNVCRLIAQFNHASYFIGVCSG